jgi:hypothetical protein
MPANGRIDKPTDHNGTFSAFRVRQYLAPSPPHARRFLDRIAAPNINASSSSSGGVVDWGIYMQQTTGTSANTPKLGHNFSFQIADGGGRRACSVTILSPTRESAELYFQENAPSIVQMARERLSTAESAAGPLSLQIP